MPSSLPPTNKDEIQPRYNTQGGCVGVSFGGIGNDACDEFPPAYLLSQGVHFHAQRTPDRLCFRLSLGARGSDNTDDGDKNDAAYVDVSFARAAVLVDAVADKLRATLTNAGIVVGAGTTVSLLTLPYCDSFVQVCALWHLGCSVQWFNHELGRDVVDNLLEQASSRALLFAGLTADEERQLDLAGLAKRINVPAIRLSDDELLVNIIRHTPHGTPSPPMSLVTFLRAKLEQADFAVSHTSGSTGVPKIVRWDSYGLGTQCKPALVHPDKPILIVTRPYWGTSIVLLATSRVSGTPLAWVRPADRVYPTTREALEAVAATQARTVVLFASQAHELQRWIAQDERYARAVATLELILFAGTGVDSATSAIMDSIQRQSGIAIANLHGMSEIMATGLGTFRAPYNGMESTHDALLMQPLDNGGDDEDDDNDGNSGDRRLVKLWISMDLHPILWYQFARGFALSLKIERYPGPGPMHDRPAYDTGDVLVQRTMPDGRTLYFQRGRSDDLIRLSNLYRPDVQELEGQLSASLVRSGRLRAEVLQAVQLFGDAKPKLAAVVQLRAGEKDDKLDGSSGDDGQVKASDCVRMALDELDMRLPDAVRFKGDMRRVLIIRRNDAVVHEPTTSSSSTPPPSLTLLVTHKGNLRRRVNTKAFAEWLDALPWHDENGV